MQISGADRYNPAKLEQLEAYVREQVATGSYDLDANLAVLRIYNFQPSQTSPDILGQVLLKALLQLPDADFALYLHLIPEPVQGVHPLPSIVSLWQSLTGAQFREFWDSAESCKELLDTVPNFHDAARGIICRMLGNTFQKLPRSFLAQSLRLEGAALNAFLEQKQKTQGWSLLDTEKGAIVSLPKNEQNAIRTHVASGGAMSFDQIAPLLAATH